MVQGVDVIQVDVAFLTYNPNRSVDSPSVKLDSTCIAGLFELKKHRELKRRQKHDMGLDAYKHYKWYNLMLRSELNAAENKTKVRIIHWHIQSGNSEAFIMDDVLYKSVSIIIGPDTEHWYCANTGQNSSSLYGSRLRVPKTMEKPLGIRLADLLNTSSTSTTETRTESAKTYEKCSPDYCANNCVECKKYVSPFLIKKQKKTKCSCYTDNYFGKIEEESEEDVESDENDKNNSIVVYSRAISSDFNCKKITANLGAIEEE